MKLRLSRLAAVFLLLAGTIAFALEWQECLPGVRNFASTALDTVNRRALLFSGDGSGGLRTDAWEIAPTDSYSFTWTKLTPTGTPPSGRWGHRAVYDCNAQRMLVFGGNVGGSHSNEVWSLSLVPGSEHWELLTPSGTPPAGRNLSYTIFHPGRNSMMTFGGSNGSTWFNDLFELKLDSMAWRQIQAGGTPSGRSQGCVMYDPVEDRMVIACGYNSGGFFNEAWALDLTPGSETWDRLNPSGPHPAVRAAAGYAGDPVARRLYLFAGFDYGVGLYNDLYALDLVAMRWANLNPAGSLPTERRGSVATYFPWHNQFLVYGGQDYDGFCGDAFFIQPGEVAVSEWSPTTAPAAPALFVDGVVRRPVRFRYTAGPSPVVEVRILDASGRVVRTLRPGADSRGSGVLFWDGCDDGGRAVTAGAYYGYLQTGKSGVSQKFVLTD